ncbi:1-phosphofructokinase family hexose kinase [Phenylobacterium sp.]|uniref:1-phosphofructokinase family hexose kinase n=1 Tax=Phenylobacterium sp. TaxID=1871053 RepID=UPI00262933C8|nr:1-phosphofructokinase family hexose kinase [Phenylobacterium sp.]
MSLVATLTMNPAIDLFTAVDRVEAGPKLRCHGAGRDPGGGGINVARVVHRLGGSATAVFPAGGFTGDQLRALVRAEGVACRTIPIAGETREDVTVFDERAESQFRFVLPGPHLHGAEWLACLHALANLTERPSLVCASGSLPPGAPDDLYARVAEIAAGFGARFVLDASGPALNAALDAHLHLIKPNLAELAELAGRPLDSEAAQVAACRDLMRGRRLEFIALTLGKAGALLVTRTSVKRIRPPPLRAVSAVGAGDSFLGGMVWALAAGQPIEEAFRYGAAAGAAAVLAPGTELCSAADVRRFAPDLRVESPAEPESPEVTLPSLPRASIADQAPT